MSDIGNFIEEYSKLVIGEEHCTHFTIGLRTSGERWGSWNAKLIAEESVNAKMAQMAHSLPVGRHAVVLIAHNQQGSVMGQLGIIIDGQSQAARKAETAMQANVQGMGTVMQGMEQVVESANHARQTAQKESEDLRARIREMHDAYWQAVTMANEVHLERRREQLEEEGAAAKQEAMMKIAEGLLPMLNHGAELVAEWAKHYHEKTEHEREMERRKWEKERKTKGAEATEGTAQTAHKPN